MIIVASKPGELGNRLFVFANFIASALENKFELVDPAFDEYAKYFPATSQDLFCRYPLRRSFIKPSRWLRRWLYQLTYYTGRVTAKSGIKSKWLRTITLDWEDTCDLGGSEFLSLLRRRQIIFIQGWLFRDQPAVIRNAAQLREIFKPLDEHRNNVAALIAK